MRYLFAGSINRSGGSLLMRLLDGHSDVMSYPIEFGFPKSNRFFPFVDHLNGTPLDIPEFKPERDSDILKFLDISETKPPVTHRWGKEGADPVGVRLNYLEKEFYGKVNTNFDYDKYIRLLREYGAQAKSLQDVYDARHKAYFHAWDDGKYIHNMEYVAFHDSGGIFITNIEKFFEEFKTSVFIYPIRSVYGYISSEKTRIARRFYGSRRFPKVKMPNYFVKMFKTYDLNALIRTWLVALTRVVILQERFGVDGKFFVYRYENLLDRTEDVMRALCAASGLRFVPCLLTPTIAHQPWGGSSHQGKQSGINRDLAHYYPEVLSQEELDQIQEQCGPLIAFLEQSKSTPTALTEIPRDKLFDYEFQKKYSVDREKWALYCAFAFTGVRRVLIWAPDKNAVFAYMYSKWIQMIHMPRLWRLRTFPGWGKQNYT